MLGSRPRTFFWQLHLYCSTLFLLHLTAAFDHVDHVIVLHYVEIWLSLKDPAWKLLFSHLNWASRLHNVASLPCGSQRSGLCVSDVGELLCPVVRSWLLCVVPCWLVNALRFLDKRDMDEPCFKPNLFVEGHHSPKMTSRRDIRWIKIITYNMS